MLRILMSKYWYALLRAGPKAVPAKGPLLRLVDYLNTQVTSQIIWFWIMVICIVVYIFLSLVRLREPFNLDKMLHRGKYDDKGDHQKATNKWRAV